MVKRLLKKIIPATYFRVDEEEIRISEQLNHIQKQLDRRIDVMEDHIRRVEEKNLELSSYIKELHTQENENYLRLKDMVITKSEQTNSILASQYECINSVLHELNDNISKKDRQF